MSPITSNHVMGTWSGLLYGVMLSAIGVLAAGAGHGTYAPLLISSAPFGLLGSGSAIVGCLVLWAGMGAATEWMPSRALIWLKGGLLLQYGISVWALIRNPDSVFVAHAPLPLWIVCGVWIVVYISGQILIWRSFGRAASRRMN
jgi:hypothetical protein